jgi:hypothetical protein
MASAIVPPQDEPTNNHAPDPYDPKNLRLTQDFATSVGVKKAILTIPVRKPAASWFVRVHADASMRLQTALLELKEDRETYLVAPSLWPELSAESSLRPMELFVGINRQGVLFVWPVALPGPDGKTNPWHGAALEAATMAQERWVRVQANMSLGAYDVHYAGGELPEPKWPELSLADILRVAFKDKRIDSHDHPVLRRLRGEI